MVGLNSILRQHFHGHGKASENAELLEMVEVSAGVEGVGVEIEVGEAVRKCKAKTKD